jgi:glycosyltransferase involved in cell wall biosynthesis
MSINWEHVLLITALKIMSHGAGALAIRRLVQTATIEGEGATSMIVVDDRWTGQNGIGRYAAELLPRISLPLVSIDPSGSPSSPIDFVFKRVSARGQAPSSIYSPGYNGFLRAVPQTITVLDLIHLQSPGAAKYRPYYDFFLKPLLKKNRHVITISETSKCHIERWLDDERVVVINAGMGSSPEFSLPGSLYRSARPYFLYVGNLRAHKNVETIVSAMAQVDADLIIVSSDGAGVRQLADRHGVSERVQTLSGVDDTELARLYRGARATLQPSLLEGFGLPALESALCGTPVIFFYGCESVREICAGGGIAVMDATNAGEWADAMRSIAEGQPYPPGVLTADDYSWDRVGATVSQTLDHYR